MSESFIPGGVVVLGARVAEPTRDEYPRNPQPTAVKFKVTSLDGGTYHLGSSSSAVAATLQTLESGTATSGAASTLTDTGKNFEKDKYGVKRVGQYVGKLLRITSGTGSGQERYVESHTATVLTVSKAWTTPPDATSVYSITDGVWEYEWNTGDPVTLPATLSLLTVRVQPIAEWSGSPTPKALETFDLRFDRKEA